MSNYDSSSTPPRVLIVDDHPSTATMLARAIGKLETPVEILTASSGEDALRKLENSYTDVLITDFIMPGISGLELIKILQEKHKPTHTILLTAFDTPGLSFTSRRLDIQNYLVKPVDPVRIRDIVAMAINQPKPNLMSDNSGSHRRPFKILIADDNTENLRLLSCWLHDEGYEYTSALDGNEALDKLRSTQPDLALIDVNMPGKNGFEVLKEIKADPSTSQIPVIMISASRISVKDVQEGFRLGADDYITKPVDWRELATRIKVKLSVKHAEDTIRKQPKEHGKPSKINHRLNGRSDIEELAKTVLSRIVNTLEANNGHLVIFHSDGSVTYQVHKEFDCSPWTWKEVQHKFTSSSIVSEIIDTGQGIVIQDIEQQKNWQRIPNDQSHSAIAVPLLGHQDVIGILMLTHNQHAYFKLNQLEILQAIASQAAIAIENAQLYATERKRVNELVALNQLTREISQFSHFSELHEKLPELVRRRLSYPAVALWLVEGNQLTLKHLSGQNHAPRHSLMKIGPNQVLITQQPVQLSGPLEERQTIRENKGTPPVQSVIAVPIFTANKIDGVLSIHAKQVRAFQESDRVVLETLAMQIETASERIRLFESIEQEKQRLAAVLNAAADAILLVDQEKRIQLVNIAGERLFTDVNTRVGQILPIGYGYDSLVGLINNVQDTKKPTEAEVDWPDQRMFSAFATPIDAGGLVVVLHDITHFIDLERVKNEFIATASHDLKNPIHAVLGYSDLLGKAGPLNDMQKEFVNYLKRASNQMYELVLNMLELARIDLNTGLNIQAVNFQDLLVNLSDEFQTQARDKGHKLIFDYSENHPKVKIDQPRIRQVLQNLIGNAIKYTPNEGIITVSTELDRSLIWIHVRDNGLGIPEEDLPHIFEKFYRVDADDRMDIQGNGLGLAIVKAIVEQHGGNIKVSSKLGQGSCFSFSLPIVKEPIQVGA
ncbi:MAG: response regulator [Anaerolineales bacterium]